MTTKRELERRLRALEPDVENWYDGLLIRDVMGEIEEDKQRLLAAEDPILEYAFQLQEVATLRGGEITLEDAKREAEEIMEAVSAPWLSKERAWAGGKQRT